MATPKNPVTPYERFFNGFFEKNFKDVSKGLQGLGFGKPLKTLEVIVDRIRKIENVDKAFYQVVNHFYIK